MRSLALLALLVPALALAGTITTGPTPEEQAKAAKAQAAKAKPAPKAPAKKPAAKKKPPATKPQATKAPAAPPPADAEAATPVSPARPSSAKENFRKVNPCPSTGRSSGSCPGYEVEHMNPPACGGADSPGNMQWVPASAARKKGAPECKTR